MQPLLLMGAVVAALSVPSLVPSRAAAEHPGDPQSGYEYAERVCSGCHGISAEPSPMPRATRFREVADRSGMTGTALRVWMETMHPTMPNIIVSKQDMLNVVAYILDLKGRDQPAN